MSQFSHRVIAWLVVLLLLLVGIVLQIRSARGDASRTVTATAGTIPPIGLS